MTFIGNVDMPIHKLRMKLSKLSSRVPTLHSPTGRTMRKPDTANYNVLADDIEYFVVEHYLQVP